MDAESDRPSTRRPGASEVLRPSTVAPGATGSPGQVDDDDLRYGFGTPVPDRPPATTSADDQPSGPGPRRRTNTLLIIAAAAVLAVALVVIAVLGFRLGAASTESTATAPVVSASSSAPTTLPVNDIYNQVAPSVVLIRTEKGALGSGTVVNGTGLILTSNHVVDDDSDITVTFSDGTRSTAQIADADPSIDIATLQPASLPEVVIPAVLGGGVTVGSDVVAIGHPLGFTFSTTSGIVSGLDRTANTDAGKFEGLIQFDAAVNPGSSGGPLLDAQGLVVGVVMSIADPGEDDAFAGIAFAVPLGTALGGSDGAGPGGPQL